MGNRKQPTNKKGKKIKRPKAKDLKKSKALIVVPDEEAIEGEVLEDNKKDHFGRPTVVTIEVKALLLTAFANGCTNKEAAIFAGIAERTLDSYNKKDPDFKEHCVTIKETPSLTARMTLVKALANSPYYALKFLERKNSEEFSIRVRQTMEPPEPLSEEEIEELNAVLDENF